MSTRHRPIVARPLARIRSVDRLWLASTVNGLLVLVWFLLQLVHPLGPKALIWVSTPIAGTVSALAVWRVSATSPAPATRRFWRQTAVASVFVTIGQTLQGIDVIRHPADFGEHLTPGMQIWDGLAVLLVVYMLYRLPLDHRQTPGQLLRVVLDAGTVMVATGVFIWHFETRKLIGVVDGPTMLVSLLLTILVLVAVFGLMKVSLSGRRTIDVPALRLLALALIMGAMGPTLRPYIVLVRPELYPTAVSVPWVFLCVTWSAERQRMFNRSSRRGVSHHRPQSYSLLPYLAVAAVDGLLIAVASSDQLSDLLVVVIAAVALTALVVWRQITALIDNGRLLERLDHSATHDALTQLPNRVLFADRLQQALAAPHPQSVSVALIDLDDFKEVNDNLGHEVGDLLLKSVARRLAECVSSGDTVARLGGDEFVVVMDGSEPGAVDRAAERMVAALSRPAQAGQYELPVQASIGVADGRTGDEASLLLRHADIAMYAAKGIAGTAYLHHHPGMDVAGIDQAHLGAQLREAIGANQLFLVYQPIVALADARPLGAETLVRWAHPMHGTLTPDTFLPLAERTGLIVPLDRWVLDHALHQLALWSARPGPAAPAVVRINVSARSLIEADFVSEVETLLSTYEIEPGRVVLEITDGSALHPGHSGAALSRLRDLGVCVSLDDFGTGPTALAVLSEVAVDEIKLDPSFTRAAGEGRTAVAAAVLHLAQSLSLHAVAEGIETREQAARLAALGYPAGQGHLFAQPMTADHLDEWFARSSLRSPAGTRTP